MDVAAVTSVLLAALTCLLGVYAPSNYEPTPAINLPFTHNQRSGCFLPPEGAGVVLQASHDMRLYFAHNSRAVQTETVRRVAARHGIRLDARQLAELRKLAYIGLKVQQLPQYLALSPLARQQLNLPGIPADSLNNQLAEYITVSRAVTLEQTGYSSYVMLEFDKNLPMGTVKHIMRTLRRQGIRRCHYVAWMP